MSLYVLLGLLIGGGLGLANAGASLLLYSTARTRSVESFDRLILGGMFVRMVFVLVTVALVLWLAPVDVFAFIASFLAVLVVGIVFEIAYVLRRPVRPAH